MIDKNIKIGDTVKMNPFTHDKAERDYCNFFDGELQVLKTHDRWDTTTRVSVNQTWWNREWLLVKGVDYDATSG